MHYLCSRKTVKAMQMEGAIAQLVEQRTENPCVPGSIPGGTTEEETVEVSSFFCVLQSACGARVEFQVGREYK